MPIEFFPEEHKEFQSVLRGLRAEQKISQAHVARSMGVSQQTAARFESGERRMDLVELRHWCLAVGVSIEEVVQRFLAKVKRKPDGNLAGA